MSIQRQTNTLLVLIFSRDLLIIRKATPDILKVADLGLVGLWLVTLVMSVHHVRNLVDGLL